MVPPKFRRKKVRPPTCQVPYCAEDAMPRTPMCPLHWTKVPLRLRLACLQLFKAEGYPQELAHPTRDWLHAVTNAIDAVTERDRTG